MGEMLMQAGRPAEALVEFARSQTREPNRLRGLYGAGLAAAQAGDRDKAKHYYGRVAQLAGDPDSRPELKQLRDSLASN